MQCTRPPDTACCCLVVRRPGPHRPCPSPSRQAGIHAALSYTGDRTITAGTRLTRRSLSRGFLTPLGPGAVGCHRAPRVQRSPDTSEATGYLTPLPPSTAKADSSLQAPAELFPMAVAKPPLQTAAILLLLLVAAASWLQTADAASGTCCYVT